MNKFIKLNLIIGDKKLFSTIFFLFKKMILMNPLIIFIALLVSLIFPIEVFVFISSRIDQSLIINCIIMFTIPFYSINVLSFIHKIKDKTLGDRLATSKYNNNQIKTTIFTIFYIFNLIITFLLMIILTLISKIIFKTNLDNLFYLNIFLIIPYCFISTLFFMWLFQLNINLFFKNVLIFLIIQVYTMIGITGINYIEFPNINSSVAQYIEYYVWLISNIIIFPFSMFLFVMYWPLTNILNNFESWYYIIPFIHLIAITPILFKEIKIV